MSSFLKYLDYVMYKMIFSTQGISWKGVKGSRMLPFLSRPIILLTRAITSQIIITFLLESFSASNDATVETSHIICNNASSDIKFKTKDFLTPNHYINYLGKYIAFLRKACANPWNI